MTKINETLMKDPQKVWQTLKKFDYPDIPITPCLYLGQTLVTFSSDMFYSYYLQVALLHPLH